MSTVDARGKEIKLGHTVAFPGRYGSSMWLNIGKVIDITVEERHNYWRGKHMVPVIHVMPDNGKKTRTEILSRVVVIS